MLACAREIVPLERALDPRGLREQAGILLQHRAELHVDVRRRRPVHPGDLHVAAEGDRADSVLDSLSPHLHECRRETEVEAAGIHSDCTRDEKVARFVQEDQEGEAEDGDRDAHARHRRS